MTTKHRIPDGVAELIDEMTLCSECFPEIEVTRLPGGTWEIRSTHTPDCCRPAELVYV